MENNELNLPNLGVLIAKIPDDLLKKLKIDCLNFLGKQKMISSITSHKVAEHYHLENNNMELFNFLLKWVKKYNEKYKYVESFNFLKKDVPLFFSKPWFNIQKKGEFVPAHKHDGILSYSIWVQIPNLEKINNNKFAGCFEILYQDILGVSNTHKILLDKELEGTFVLFPSKLTHCAYPFFDTDEIRISISGNILFDNTIEDYK
jgi:hypothetical protein